MANLLPSSGYILGLDVGDSRIGVAIASAIARLPQPLDAIAAGENAVPGIIQIIAENDIKAVVVGVPRNLEGDETAQSQKIRDFAGRLKQQIEVPVIFADESLSSVRAEDLAKDYTFKNVSSDSLAACFILEEYFLQMFSTTGELPHK